jgi:hypothetical protein
MVLNSFKIPPDDWENQKTYALIVYRAKLFHRDDPPYIGSGRNEFLNQNRSIPPNTTTSEFPDSGTETKRLKQKKRRQRKREQKRERQPSNVEHRSTTESEEDVKTKSRRFKLAPHDRKRLDYFLILREFYRQIENKEFRLLNGRIPSFGQPGFESRLASAKFGPVKTMKHGAMKQFRKLLEEDMEFLKSQTTIVEKLLENLSSRPGSLSEDASALRTTQIKLGTVLRFMPFWTRLIDHQRTWVVKRLQAANKIYWTPHPGPPKYRTRGP